VPPRRWRLMPVAWRERQAINAVRRLTGPAAGLTAAAVLGVTPVTVLLSRGSV